MNRKTQLFQLLSAQVPNAAVTSPVVARLLTEIELDLVSGGDGHSQNGNYTQTSGNFSQTRGNHSQIGGGSYEMKIA